MRIWTRSATCTRRTGSSARGWRPRSSPTRPPTASPCASPSRKASAPPWSRSSSWATSSPRQAPCGARWRPGNGHCCSAACSPNAPFNGISRAWSPTTGATGTWTPPSTGSSAAPSTTPKATRTCSASPCTSARDGRSSTRARDSRATACSADEELQALVRHRPDRSINLETVEADFARVQDLYYENGYIFNGFDQELTRDDERGTILVRVAITERKTAPTSRTSPSKATSRRRSTCCAVSCRSRSATCSTAPRSSAACRTCTTCSTSRPSSRPRRREAPPA